MENIIKYLYNKVHLTKLDIFFADFINKLSKQGDHDIALAAALVSNVTGKGHVCLELNSVSKMFDDIEFEPDMALPEFSVWVNKLRESSVVGSPGEYFPLILDKNARLYLYRYWDYENQVSELLKLKAELSVPVIDHNRLLENLNQLFPSQNKGIDLQKLAALICVLKKLCVITGGPGTGKTTTIVKIIALLLEQSSNSDLRIFLAAPTGKAAARLGQAIKAGIEFLDCPESIKQAIPIETFTIHRLLKPIKDTPYFHYNIENRLPLDVLIVDESSMIDLALMSKLLQALPERANLILVGDKDQLASVEAGYVFGDICGKEKGDIFSGKFENIVKNLIPDETHDLFFTSQDQPYLIDSIVNLKKNYRFTDNSIIPKLSKGVNKGDIDTAIQLIKTSDSDTLVFNEIVSNAQLAQNLAKIILNEYHKYLLATDPLEALKLFAKFKILCAVRKGEYGVEKINYLAEQVFHKKGLIKLNVGDSGTWYSKRPVLITRNDYTLGLFNGDIGIAMDDPETGELFVYFEGISGEVRRFPYQSMPAHETAYAITVHKSQGSEFDSIVLILPDSDSPLLTRELIYTGITRAKKRVAIWGKEQILKESLTRKINRSSGLNDSLWQDS